MNDTVSLRKVFLKPADPRRPQDSFAHLGDLYKRWIWLPGPRSPDGQVVLFRRKLKLGKALRTRFHVSADHRFDLFIDGALLARGPERGDPNHWFVHTYELRLAPGEHTLLARCWHLPGMVPLAQMTTRGAGFLFCAEGKAGASLSTGTAPWEVCPLAAYRFKRPWITWGSQGHTFVDGAGLPPDFSATDELPWQTLPAIPRHDKTDLYHHFNWYLRPSTLPDMMNERLAPARVRFAERLARREDALSPLSMARHDADLATGLTQLLTTGQPLVIPPKTRAQWLLDFEEYRCAYPELKTSGGAGSDAQLYWAESLYHPPHSENRKGNRDAIEGKIIHADGDNFLPDGRDVTFDLLWWRVGRYVQLLVETGDEPLTVRDLVFYETGYPLKPVNRFSASDPSCAAVLPNLHRALQASMHDIYADGPYYEQLMYLGDTRIETLATYMYTRDDRLPRKALQMFDWSRLPEGFTQSRYPSAAAQVIPTFSLWWVCMVQEYLMWRDDLPFVAGLLPGVRAVLDACERYRDPDGLLRNVPWWNFVDWSGAWQVGLAPDTGKGANGLLNLHYVLALQAAAAMESAVGSPELARLQERRARAVRAAVIRTFWSPSRKLFACDEERVVFSEHMQILALLAGACDAGRRRRLRATLTGPNNLDKATIYFMHYLFEALPGLNAMPCFFERLATWTALPALGFKALPESPDPCRSDCHGWGVHPIYHFYTKLLGITPASPGFATVRIEPRPCHLRRISGTLPHPKGFIRVTLDLDKGIAEIVLPAGLSGTFIWNNRKIRLKSGKQRIVIKHPPAT